MFGKKYSTIFVITALVMISASQSWAAHVIGIRSNSEADKTRIVVELDGPAQYQAHYTSEAGISICLLGAGLKSIRRTLSIDDEMVETVALKEVMGNIVEVSISLRREASFTIFPLDSPDRMVVDVMSDAAVGIAQPLSISESGSEAMTRNSPGTHETLETETPGTLDHEVAGTQEQPLHTSVAVPPGPISVLPLQDTDYILAQFCFNALLVTALIFMGIKLWRVTRVSERNLNTLKEGADFADMVNRLQSDAEERDNSLERQHALPIRPDVSGKAQKRRKRKRRVTRPAAAQKQYEKVHRLAQLGMDQMEISQQSNVPIGEVNLILNLTKARSQAKAN